MIGAYLYYIAPFVRCQQ